MAKLFNFLKPVNNPVTKGFDLSKNQSFSFGAGMAMPTFYRMVMNKSHLSLSLDNGIINTTPMVNQPFSRGNFYTDVYQVPLSQLWSEFNEYYAQARELMSSAGLDFEDSQDLKNFEYQPVFSLPFIITACFYDLLRLFGIYATQQETLDWQFPDPITYVNEDGFVMGFDVHGYPRALGALRLLDMFGYGNWYLQIKELFTDENNVIAANWFQSGYDDETACELLDIFIEFKLLPWFVGNHPNSYQINDEFVDRADPESYLRLVQNISEIGVDDPVNGRINAKLRPFGMVSPWPLLAYQKVFCDIYRNTFYDKSNVWSFNVDYWMQRYDGIIAATTWMDDDPSSLHSDQFHLQFTSIFELHYRQFKKDMFTSLLPDSQFGDVATVSVGDSEFQILNTHDYPGSGEAMNVYYKDKTDGVELSGQYIEDYGPHDGNKWKLSPLPSFSVLAQRRAEALQRYKERYLRAGNRLNDQFVSMFGQVPYYLQDKYCRYLGSLDSGLGNTAVPATAQTGDYNVAERASYGTSNMKGKIECDIADMSIVIAITYFLPEADYESFNIDPIHTKLHFLDLPQIEFENLGLAPVYRNALSVVPTAVDTEEEISGNDILGYAPPYLEWKTDVDRLHGEFGTTKNLKGVYSSWVTSRGNVSMRALSDYYVDPAFINSIMVSQFDGSQAHDPFLCFFMFNCKVVQPLTVTGLPIWN